MGVTSREARHCSIAELKLCDSINIIIRFWQSRAQMAPRLPDDILHVLCEELANLGQFDTLFNCACASRVLAVPALTNLYRCVTCTLPSCSPLTMCIGHTMRRQFEAVEMMRWVLHLPRGCWSPSGGLSCGGPLSPQVLTPLFSRTVATSRR